MCVTVTLQFVTVRLTNYYTNMMMTIVNDCYLKQSFSFVRTLHIRSIHIS